MIVDWFRLALLLGGWIDLFVRIGLFANLFGLGLWQKVCGLCWICQFCLCKDALLLCLFSYCWVDCALALFGCVG